MNQGNDHQSTDGFSGVRVLLVGDEDDFICRLGELINTSGHRTKTAHDARAAIEVVGGGEIDVIVCDLGATKLQSIATILALRPLGDDAPPVVAVSGIPNLAQHCRSLNVKHFLPQPLRLARLLEAVVRVGRGYQNLPNERSGVYLREQTQDILEHLPELDALSFG